MKSKVAVSTALQVKKVQKTKKVLEVTFDQPYEEPPVVILTPFWEGNGPVGSIPTVDEITKKGCKIISGNAATNYFVNVLSIPAGETKLVDRRVHANSVLKTGKTVEVFYNPPFESNDPVTLLTAYWKGANSAVGAIETLDDSAASEAKIVSGNAADNFFTNYMAIDAGISDDGSSVMEANIVNKAGKGKQRVYFSTRFQAPPVISLSPWWNDANSGVGSIETVTRVTTEYFELVSDNAAANYFVCWMAVGE